MQVLRALAALAISLHLTCAAPVPPPPPTTSLLEASRMGFVDEVRALLARGADPNPTNAQSLGPLAAARAAGFTEVAEILVAYGATEPTEDEAFRAPLTQEFQTQFGSGTPGVAILVARAGEVIFAGTYGDAQIEQVPVTLDTQFRIGSVTKQFTAAAILLLQQDGRLSVHDPLSRWVPEFPRGNEITLHHLLSHTAGIANYTAADGFHDTVAAFTTTEELLASFMDTPLEFEPGTRFAYSNSGYVLLGAVIERASGSTYAEFLAERIFHPLEMNDSGVYPGGVAADREAHGYSWTGDPPTAALDWDMSRAGAAGALYSTAHDLERWSNALFRTGQPKLLSEQSLADALADTSLLPEHAGAPSRTAGYGYGFGIGTLRGLQVISHSGGLPGFSSYLAWVPAAELTIIVLHNARPSRASARQMAAPIIPLLLWRQMDERASIQLDPLPQRSAYDDFVGRYQVRSWVQTITREGDRLYSQITGQARYEIYPRLPLPGTAKSETPFFFRITDAQLVFVRDESGVVAVRHEQDGDDFLAPKLASPRAVHVPIEVLDDYVGRYDYGGATLEVTREGDHLFAKLDGQDRYEISPATENEFHWLVVDARITFVRAADSGDGRKRAAVTHVIHDQGTRRFEAPRID